MILIEIDTREKKIFNNFLSRNLDIYKQDIEIISKTLELSDIILNLLIKNYILKEKHYKI